MLFLIECYGPTSDEEDKSTTTNRSVKVDTYMIRGPGAATEDNGLVNHGIDASGNKATKVSAIRQAEQRYFRIIAVIRSERISDTED